MKDIKHETKEELEFVTDEWLLYEKGVNYNKKQNLYADTDKNFRFYNEDQWSGLKSGSIAPVTYNIIKPIVKYKVGSILTNLLAINYSAENWENEKFQKKAEQVCEKLNKHVARLWEKDYMDYRLRKCVKQSCINGEAIIYVNNDENNEPLSEIISKNNILYGDENQNDIQRQPYILIPVRKTLKEVIEIARENGLSEEDIKNITPDNLTSEEAGDSAKEEVDNKVLVITKFIKKNGTVWKKMSAKHVVLEKEYDTKLTLYPIAHLNWEEVEGSARGMGEVKYLIPNQIEVNRNLMRRLVATKYFSYPQRIVNIEKVVNPKAIDKIGQTIKIKDMLVDDVKKYIGFLQPAPMSNDADSIGNELITNTRELAGAGDIATGEVNPEQASGRSILALQNVAQQSLNEQLMHVKMFVEDLGRIYIDQWKTYNKNGMIVLEEKEVEEEGEYGNKKMVTQKIPYKIPGTILQKLKTDTKVDITPKSAYDKLAYEMSLENLLTNKWITFDEYVKLLPYDSAMPKSKLEEVLEHREEEQAKIQQIEREAVQMQNQMNQYLQETENINNIDMEGQQLIEQAENQGAITQ